ncbi:CotO family spore coat protein [Paraliobacillus sediminis]|uniref:CotO family spore coat protein n=1 Tax=Paraliobacillus sediminis TaxID=1885916 RepID=UPI000E3DD1D8|nr:CotO family spore coat protein [Paraliobacillus sediminis]
MSRRKKRYSARPVLYIQQPDFEVPAASMQADYFTPKEEKEATVSHASVPIESQARGRKSKKKTKIIPELEKPVDDFEEDKDDEEREVNTDLKDEEFSKEMESSDKEEEEETQFQSKEFPTKKPFSEMTIEEQVDYLATKPSPHIPKMKCEVIAQTGRYRGIITAFDANVVQIETFKRPKFHQVDLEEIESIRLLGF